MPEDRREEWSSTPVRPSGIDSSILYAAYRYEVRSRAICGYGVVVTQVLAKHLSRVRIPLAALRRVSNRSFAFGSTVLLVRVQSRAFALVAQLAEHVYSPSSFGLVAQLVKALACHAKEHGFESRQDRSQAQAATIHNNVS